MGIHGTNKQWHTKVYKILKTLRACILQKLNFHPEQLAGHKIHRWCINCAHIDIKFEGIFFNI